MILLQFEVTVMNLPAVALFWANVTQAMSTENILYFFKPHYLYLLWICWTTCRTSYNRSKACNKSATSGRAGGNWHQHVHKKSAINPQQIAVTQFEQVRSCHLSFTWISLPEDEVGCWDEVRYSMPRDISATATVWPIFIKFGMMMQKGPLNRSDS